MTTTPPTPPPPPPPPSSTSTSPADDGTSFDDGATTCAFLGCGNDANLDPFECDPWAQDCPPGEKCMPWANDGGPHWNATRCSPVSPAAGQVGDPCSVEGAQVSGIDDCDLGLFCAWTNEFNEGTCVAMCGGTARQPQCADPDTACVVDYDGTITLCLPRCDLVLQDCPPDQGACWVDADTTDAVPTCGIAAPTLGTQSEPCDYDWDCAPGNLCHPGDQLAMCAFDNCCTPVCSTVEPPLDCFGGEECVALIPEGTAPGTYPEGYCALPP